MATGKYRVYATSSQSKDLFLPHFYIDVEADNCQSAFNASRSVDYANYHEDTAYPENALSSIAMVMLNDDAAVDIRQSGL